jgi:hypothetical protein
VRGRLRSTSDGFPFRLSATVARVAVVALLVPGARAQETKWTRQDALHDASSEAAQCQAYYALSQKCADNAGQKELSDLLRQAIESASQVLFTSGKAAGMSDHAMIASLKLSLDAAKDSKGNSCVNLSVLIVRYGNSCKLFLEHPGDRIQTLMLGPPKPSDQ